MVMSIPDRTRVLMRMVELESAGELDPKFNPVLEAARAKGWIDPPAAPSALESAIGPINRFTTAVRTSGPIGAAGALLGSFLPEEEAAAAMVAAGETATNLGRGAQDLYGRVTDDPALRQQVAGDVAESARLTAPLEQEYPASTTAGGLLPYFAFPAARGLAGTTATGATIGLLDPESTAAQGAGGALVGGLLGRAMGRVLSPGATAREGTEQALQAADDLGLSVMPSQLSTGGRMTQNLEAGMGANPVTAGAIDAAVDANARRANQIAAASIGQRANAVTDETLGAAHQALGRQFDDIGKTAAVPLDDTFLTGLARIENEFVSTWGANNPVAKIIDDALEEAATSKGVISGERYMQLRSRLAKRVNSLFRSQVADPDEAFAVSSVIDLLDDAMERNMGPALRQQYAALRSQYRNLMSLEAPGVVNSATGDVSLATLGNVLKRRDQPGYLRGGNRTPLYQAARVGQAFKPLQSSGTTERGFGGIMPYVLAGGAVYDPATTAGIALGSRGLAELYTRFGTPYLRSNLLGGQGRGLLQTLGAKTGAAAGFPLLGSQ